MGGGSAREDPIAARRKSAAKNEDRGIEQWLNRSMTPRHGAPQMPVGPLRLSRFKDPTYFLLQSISWKPNPEQTGRFAPVEVPAGFVTDFASVPRFFWSVLRPDGEYTYPAIIHDYLYWVQSRPREVADSILLLAMEDFRINERTRMLIYQSVRDFGYSAWNENAKLKAQGEKRILKEFPEDPTLTWENWRRRPGVFAS
jgi:hypothetical protein